MTDAGLDAWHVKFFTDLYTASDLEFNDPTITAKMIKAVTTVLRRAPGRRVLDVACGIGRHAIPLSCAGFDVTGIDLSEPYLQIARTVAHASHQKIQFVQADMRNLMSIATASMDAAVNLHTSFGFYNDEADNSRVLTEIRRTLSSRGLLIMDVLNRDAFLRQTPEIYAVAAGEFVIRNFDSSTGTTFLHEEQFDPLTSRIRWTVTDTRDPGGAATADYRTYSAHELIAIVTAAGFRVTDVFGDYDLSPFHTHSPSIVCVASVADESNAPGANS